MPKISDLQKYNGVLPYASEMFGVYQPMLGWTSKRKKERAFQALKGTRQLMFDNLLKSYQPKLTLVDGHVNINEIKVDMAEMKSNEGFTKEDSLLLHGIWEIIKEKEHLNLSDWKDLLSPDFIQSILHTNPNAPLEAVPGYYQNHFEKQFQLINNSIHEEPGQAPWETETRKKEMILDLRNSILTQLSKESMIAGFLTDLMNQNMEDELNYFFFRNGKSNLTNQLKEMSTLLQKEMQDPFLSFDPNKDIADVSISPVGIVHLYKQFFFELDSFLGPAVEHVWIPPKAVVELVEVSSRKTTTEKSYESNVESFVKQDKSSTTEDDIRDAISEENKSDTKLGFSTQVNASYPTVSIEANASINMNRTQRKARETTQKHLRQQSETLSSEIRQNYKSTFKVVTEEFNQSSKKYVLTNPSEDKLINYELRRKMRQVGVQVQDIGSYLCWETFVDEPGKDLGLANLVHIAQPADLIPKPNPTVIPDMQTRVDLFLNESYDWIGREGDIDVTSEGKYFVIWGPTKSIQFSDGYELDETATIPQTLYPYSGYDRMEQVTWGFLFKVNANKQTFQIGVTFDPSVVQAEANGPRRFLNGFWDEHKFHFELDQILIICKLKQDRQEAINAAKLKIAEDEKEAGLENQRNIQEAFVKAAKERITLASKIKKRKFDDLREEERTIVYRRLIESLMTHDQYIMPDIRDNYKPRHVFSELINTIFDIDKMLYFVAPEWWKPRKHVGQLLKPNNENSNSILPSKVGFLNELKKPIGFKNPNADMLNPHITNWSDGNDRLNNYYITEDSEPAPLGASLGWLLQLDGDNLRNSFLNSPWVKAIIPIRPGKEQAAIRWLQLVHVEGNEGLQNEYPCTTDEAKQITDGLKNTDTPASNPILIIDAIRYLCIEIEEKYKASQTVSKFPKDPEIHDDDTVSATPIEKVYEHGFYSLQGGFRANPNPNDERDPNADPNNSENYFNIFSQWLEILPTDQLVPVPVEYNPKDGRLKNN